MSRFNSTERKGVNRAAQIFNNDLGWIWREQPVVDVGIDAFWISARVDLYQQPD
jgi:hypothetical protein